MVQHNNEHPTTAQLSAYVDQELIGDELTLCTAHLQTCQACQATLADLRFTSRLLHDMPEVEIPRSFVLPLNISVLPETPAHRVEHVQQVSKGQAIIRRTFRAVSTLAAVVGLVFILVGAFATLPNGVVTNSISTAAAPGHSTAAGHTASDASATQRAMQGLPPEATRAALTPSPVSTSTASAAGIGIHATSQPSEQQAVTLPPALDPSQPEGRLGLGALLFILGIIGALATRRKQPKSAH